MTTEEHDETFSRAADLIARSRAGVLVEGMLRGCLAAVRQSRALAAARTQRGAFRAMRAGERLGCAAVVIATAVAGHALLASMLAPPARPTVALTALALLAAGLAVVAASNQTSAP